MLHADAALLTSSKRDQSRPAWQVVCLDLLRYTYVEIAVNSKDMSVTLDA